MDQVVINKLKTNPRFREYIRYNSHWYKYLNRNSKYLKEIEEEMKIKYKLTTPDRLKKISYNIELIQTIFQILQ